MAKGYELKFELLTHSSNSPDLTPSDDWLFADRRERIVTKSSSNEDVIAKPEAYFEAKDTLFYKTGIEMLER